MKRRAFLGAAAKAGAIAVAAWPHFLRAAFADENATDKERAAKDADHRERLALISDSYRRAQRIGKPLLALIIPGDRSQKWLRGEQLGSWLNHGSPEQRWPLALCEVVCAEMNDLRQLVPTVGLGEPLMVLIETDRVPATVRRLETKLPDGRSENSGVLNNPREWQERERRIDQEIETRIALLAKLLHDAVALDAAMLEQRVAQVRTVLPPEQASVDGPGKKTLRPEEADAMAAVLALAASRADRPQRSAHYNLLADAVDQRLRKQRVPGSYWARHSGCGTTIEGAEDRGAMVACGMGHVPEKSQRFLYFFTVPKRGDLSVF
jgi:hypothetical protein